MNSLVKLITVIFPFIVFITDAFSQIQPHTERFLDLGNIDSTYQPGDDFYRYANGKWLTRTVIPESGYRMAMTDVMASSDSLMHNLLAAVCQGKYNYTPAGKQLYTFYQSALDSVESPINGLVTLKAGLNAIHQINTIKQLKAYLVRQLLLPSNKLIRLRPNEDDETEPLMRTEFTQAGLNMPLKNYASSTSSNEKIRAGYVTLLEKLFSYVGSDTVIVRKNVLSVLSIEEKLASYSDTGKVTNRLPYNDLIKTYANLPFSEIFDEFNIDKKLPVYVQHPSYYAGLNQLIYSISLSDWKLKLQADYLLFNAPYLDTQIAKANANFYEQQLKNEQVVFDRQVQVKKLLSNFYWAYNLADVLGDLYAHTYFTQRDRTKLYVLANSIRAAFAKRIELADWLDSQTRQKALRKLEEMHIKIGYPDSVANRALSFSAKNFLANYHKLYQLERLRYLRSAGKPKNRAVWRRPQWTIASSYEPEYNSFIMVTGLLKPPFYFPDADDAINYGAIGTLIAHEFTHGFDNLGVLYNEQGVKKSWFTANDSIAFRRHINPLAAQFNQYILLDTIHVKGELSLGEITADLVGISIAYDALKATNQHREKTLINGLTATQRFLLAFAQQWRSVYSDKFLKESFQEDVHPPENLRINGTLSNFTPFYDAFKVKPTNKLYKPESSRVQVW